MEIMVTEELLVRYSNTDLKNHGSKIKFRGFSLLFGIMGKDIAKMSHLTEVLKTSHLG